MEINIEKDLFTLEAELAAANRKLFKKAGSYRSEFAGSPRRRQNQPYPEDSSAS